MTALVPMRPEAFPAFAEQAIATYAEDSHKAMRWTAAQALPRARAEFERLLPQGLQTPKHQFYEILDSADGPSVGTLWFATPDNGDGATGYLFNIRIQPQFRGRGHAKAALDLLDTVAREQGLRAIALHVFGFNTTAQALYRAQGYGITGLNMIKPLRRDDDAA